MNEINSTSLKSTKTLWFPISEFCPQDYDYKPMMIASKDFIDPICNPDGVGMAWYNIDDDVFVVGVVIREIPSIDTVKISRHRVSHFIPTVGPYF